MRELVTRTDLSSTSPATVGLTLIVACWFGLDANAQGQQSPEAPPLPSSTLRRGQEAREQSSVPEAVPEAASSPAPPAAPAAAESPITAPAAPAAAVTSPANTPAVTTDAPSGPSPWAGWTRVQPPPASAPLVSVAPGAFPPSSANAAVRMHFASHGSRTTDQAGGSNQSDAVPNGQPWWYARTIGPIATPSDNEYSYFAYTPPASPLTATGMDPKFWAQDGTGYGQFGWDPYSLGGATWVGGFD